MLTILAITWLTLAGGSPPRAIPVTTRSDCPIEQMVGRVKQITGDRGDTWVLRAGHKIAVTPATCVLYGDELEAGPRTSVVIDTAIGEHHVGGIFDPVWTVPPALEQTTPSASAMLGNLFRGLMDPSRQLALPATSRGPAACRASGPGPSLTALDRLDQTEQRIGADLSGIAVAWHPLGAPAEVRARLVGLSSGPLAALACGDAPIIFPLTPRALRPGDHLRLEVSDGSGVDLSYRITVVDPSRLPAPPTWFPEDWQTAAWRLASGPPDTRLDAISRLVFAPRDALGARLILNAVWTEAPF